MLRKTAEKALEESGGYIPYVGGAAALAAIGFFSYHAYRAFYKVEFKPDGTKTFTPVPGAKANADGAEAKEDVEAIAVGKGPVNSSAAKAKSREGGVRVRAYDSSVSAELMNAASSKPSSTSRPT